jgi:hypothetical protein
MKMICFTIVLLLISNAFSYKTIAQCKPDPEGKGLAVYYSQSTFGINFLSDPKDVSVMKAKVDRYKNDQPLTANLFHFTINGKQLDSAQFYGDKKFKATFSTFEAGWLLIIADGTSYEQFYLEFANPSDPCIATIQEFAKLNK